MLRLTDFQFFDPDCEFTVTAGDLPHWEQPGATYFITYRLVDSIPQDAFDRILSARNEWLRGRGIDPALPYWVDKLRNQPAKLRDLFRRTFAIAFESELDKLAGDCQLEDPDLSDIVAKSLRVFDGQRYLLGGFVVMPNHVHVLARIDPGRTMLQQCYSWKHYQAFQANKYLGRSGKFLQAESFDHLVRGGDQFEKYRNYLATNPEKANLKASQYKLYLPDIE